MREKWINHRQLSFLAVELLSFAIALRIANHPQMPPLARNIAFGCTFVTAYLLYRNLKKIFSRSVRDRLFQKTKSLLGLLFGRLSEMVSGWLPGTHTDRIRIYGKDQRSFIFGSLQKSKKRRSYRSIGRWADQTDNHQRVRYLYSWYLIRKITGGYVLRSYRTPLEIYGELIGETMGSNDAQVLFELYQQVRYAKGSVVDDETVIRLRSSVKNL